ncbi:MAG: DUF262 domain-containing protein [Patescibacteria group bacterium]
MTGRELPKPNTQFLSWFYGEHKKGTLVLNPKYQRNPIWSIGQKCFLIDSLISGSPIPQVFINIQTTGKGASRATQYEIVDGQQRLRAVLEFMDDEYALIRTTAKSYPVSDIYEPQIGKKYSELPDSLQSAIWNYSLAVQELREWNDVEIRALFRRLNYVVEKLSNQELRHSQYFGEFVGAVEGLSSAKFWDDLNFFTRRDSQRMKDVEYVSELFAILIDGIQDQQKTLDRFYADYDVVFPHKSRYISTFGRTLESFRTIQEYLEESRFKNKADFYTLFAAVSEINTRTKVATDLSEAESALRRFEQELAAPVEQLRGKASRYYQTVIEGPNKKAKREERTAIFREILSRALKT